MPASDKHLVLIFCCWIVGVIRSDFVEDAEESQICSGVAFMGGGNYLQFIEWVVAKSHDEFN